MVGQARIPFASHPRVVDRRLARAMAQAGENSTEAPSDGSPKLLMISV
jgi:hypothetical protein